MKAGKSVFNRRKNRVRRKLSNVAGGKPRLSVFRSGANIYAQVIVDVEGRTVAAASSLDKDLKGALKNGNSVEAAQKVGELVAKRAVDAGVTDVVFDRGGYLYHGRVKALADAAREGGLKF